jgi:hypothetical protein
LPFHGFTPSAAPRRPPLHRLPDLPMDGAGKQLPPIPSLYHILQLQSLGYG